MRLSITQDPHPKTSVLMPSDIQIHRQVQQSNAKISKETKAVLHKLPKGLETF